ncbi:dihydroxy-acid dehydratase, partial [Salmonella enterica subsp. enterica serovar Kentucky]|nr:dihydroxy-acid dehydratase [Salmonella enterica subsp. enterica serovar Kentucky]
QRKIHCFDIHGLVINPVDIHGTLPVFIDGMNISEGKQRVLAGGWELKPELFDRINNEIPYLTNIQPSGEYVTEMMWFAGGVPMV